MRALLKNARLEKKLTQAFVSNELGMGERNYRSIENGESGTTEENWIKFFNLFDRKVPLDKLMSQQVSIPETKG